LSTDGLVTSFSPHNGDDIFVGGMPYHVQNADQPWSIANPDPSTLRFEIRSGDVWDEDPFYKERSGVSGESYFAAGKAIDINYDFMVEPGDPNSSEWLVIGQIHAADGFSSPPFAVELIGERLAIHLRYKLPGQQYQDWFAFIDDDPIVRGQYYNLHAKLDFEARRPSGSAEIWLDGEKIVDYSGYFGFGAGFYWKMDAYRQEAPETFAINFRGLSIEGDLGVEIYGSRNGDKIDSTHSPPGQPDLTKRGDIIYGGQGDDWIKAELGRDILLGGPGRDHLKGGVGGDTLVGGPGRDKLKGGSGFDVFYFNATSGKDKIVDFKDNFDAIALPADLVSNHTEIQDYITKIKGGIYLDIPGGGRVFMKGVSADQLTDKDDFLLL